MSRIILSSFVFIAIFPLMVLAQEQDIISEKKSSQKQSSAKPNVRPKIGLVLSGGGAKGAAHVGILKVLEQHNIPIDYIAGTSIGAYVGGMYALGYSADEIKENMLNVNWALGYSDFIPREQLRFADKVIRDEYNITVRMGYSDEQLKVPTGLLLGHTALQLFKSSTDVIASIDHFDNLAIPYRAVTTDIATAKAFVLERGSITRAMKASATVPGALEPIEIDGRLLVDGGMSNNMPIDVVKAMGADIVIAIDIGSPLLTKEQLDSTVAVLNQLSTVLTVNTTDKQKKLLTPRDILLRPAIDDLGTGDFSIMPIALSLGAKVANENLDKLKVLSVSDDEYQQYKTNKQLRSKKWFSTLERPITGITFDNKTKVSEEIIEEHFALSVGDVISKEALAAAVTRVYALDRFDFVDAEFFDSADGINRTLVLTTKAKSWGPNFIHYGFMWQGDIFGNSLIGVDVGYLLTDVTDNGGQWLNEISIGWESKISTEIYLPLDKKQLFYSRSQVAYGQEKHAKYKQREELDDTKTEVTTGLGINYINNGLIELGLEAGIGDLEFNDIDLSPIKYKTMGGYINFDFDNLNSINFPTQGNKITLAMHWREDAYNYQQSDDVDDTSVEITIDWRGALNLGSHTFVGITSLATVNNNEEFTVHVAELGGFLNLSGFNKDSLIGKHKVFGAVVYQYDLGREIPKGTGLPVYLGISMESGNVWNNEDSVKVDDLLYSGSLYLGTDTSFGPAVIGLGFATGGEISLFISLGKNW